MKKHLKTEMKNHTEIEICARSRTVDKVIKFERLHYLQNYPIFGEGLVLNIDSFEPYSLN